MNMNSMASDNIYYNASYNITKHLVTILVVDLSISLSKSDHATNTVQLERERER